MEMSHEKVRTEGQTPQAEVRLWVYTRGAMAKVVDFTEASDADVLAFHQRMVRDGWQTQGRELLA